MKKETEQLGTQEELIIPDSWRRPSDIDEPSSLRGETLKMGFYGVHGLLEVGMWPLSLMIFYHPGKHG